MAPEIAIRRIEQLDDNDVLLDPMCGSGTVLRAAVEHGVTALGVDIDPMAVLMAKVWCAPPSRSQLAHDAHEIIRRASESNAVDPVDLPWVDQETADFMSFWFAPDQRAHLSRLADVLSRSELHSTDALRVALSRIIVTKDGGASLGRDISHSRPHKVSELSDFDVPAEYMRSVRRLSERLNAERVRAAVEVQLGDSRRLPTSIEDGAVSCIVTSPPYLNAIDYLRGHRLSLVWLGYSVAEVRAIRADSIGAERGLEQADVDPYPYLTGSGTDEPATRIVGWSRRYLRDAYAASSEMARVLRPGGTATLVVGNSNIRGFRVDNAQMYADALSRASMRIDTFDEREIPTRSRYLPTGGNSALSLRMRVETVISASKA